MPLSGYTIIERDRHGRPRYYESPSGERITERQYRKVRHGGLSNEAVAKRTPTVAERGTYQWWLDQYLRHAGSFHESKRAAINDPDFQRAYQVLKQPYRKQNTMSAHRWETWGEQKWQDKIEAGKVIYGEDQLSSEHIIGILSPEQH